MPATQAFVLMNLDLIAVSLHVSGAGLVTIYCGARRANQLRGAAGRQSQPAPQEKQTQLHAPAEGISSDALGCR